MDACAGGSSWPANAHSLWPARQNTYAHISEKKPQAVFYIDQIHKGESFAL